MAQREERWKEGGPDFSGEPGKVKWDRLSRRRSRMAEASTLFRFVYPVTNRVGGGARRRRKSTGKLYSLHILGFPGSGAPKTLLILVLNGHQLIPLEP